MKTTVDIPDRMLEDVMRFTKAKTKREAIVTVLAEFTRRKRMAELNQYLGTCEDMMTSEELMEMREMD